MMLGGTSFKGKTETKATGTIVKSGETQRSAAGWGAVVRPAW